jgi:ABC-type nitrate/sulfonate/bicarbonate transport system substrate-binding protein
MKHVLTGFIKGTNPLNEAAIGQALGTPCVVVARETDGSFKVIGNKENHAMIEKITGTSGKHGSADRKGRTVVVSASGFIYTIPHYRGDTSIFPV